jgi:hypothetical protein
MRKHGWELPYHPLQVVAVAVFLALAFLSMFSSFSSLLGRRCSNTFPWASIHLWYQLATSYYLYMDSMDVS